MLDEVLVRDFQFFAEAEFAEFPPLAAPGIKLQLWDEDRLLFHRPSFLILKPTIELNLFRELIFAIILSWILPQLLVLFRPLHD